MGVDCMSSPDRVAPARQAPTPYSGLALASRGDALTPYLHDALRRRFPAVGLIDPELSSAQRYRVAALTVRPTRSGWVERFYKSGYASELRSANAARSIGALPQPPRVILQVHALFQVAEAPTAVYIDCTHAQSAQLWPAWNPLKGRSLRRWYERETAIYDSAHHLFAFSEATKSSLVLDYGIDPDKVTVTGAGVNFSGLPTVPRAPIESTKPADSAPTILFIGNDFVRKGGEVLLEAFQTVRSVIPNARLQLVGVDPGITAPPGVEVLGRIGDRDRIASLYRSATVFAVPSFFDPFPLVALEAMAFGLPVVSTRQMGTGEMIDDGRTGRLVEPGDSEAVAAALLALLMDPEAARAMGAAASHDVRLRFSWDAVVERMVPALDRMLIGLDA